MNFIGRIIVKIFDLEVCPKCDNLIEYCCCKGKDYLKRFEE